MWQKFKQTTFCQNWINLIRVLKPMTWKQRLEHIWEYHRYQILVLTVIGFSLGILVTALFSQSTEMLVSGMMTNINMEREGYTYLTNEYMEDLNGDPSWQKVELTSITLSDMLDLEDGYDSYQRSLTLIARVSGKMLDYMLMDQYTMEYYQGYDVYMDLRDVFSEEELHALLKEDRVAYMNAAEEGAEPELIPIAVRITGMPFAKDNINNEGEVFFAVSGSSPRPEMCRNVWDRIMAWETK